VGGGDRGDRSRYNSASSRTGTRCPEKKVGGPGRLAAHRLTFPNGIRPRNSFSTLRYGVDQAKVPECRCHELTGGNVSVGGRRKVVWHDAGGKRCLVAHRDGTHAAQRKPIDGEGLHRCFAPSAAAGAQCVAVTKCAGKVYTPAHTFRGFFWAFRVSNCPSQSARANLGNLCD